MKILLEGPITGYYSLSIVNRRFAEALIAQGQDVYLTDRSENDPTLDKYFIESGLMSKYIPFADLGNHHFDIHSKNDWPISPSPRLAPILTSHCYAWEETLFPNNLILLLNQYDAIMFTSSYSEAAAVSSGYTGYTAVTGNGVDHIEKCDVRSSSIDQYFDNNYYNFLHISSGLKRKGVRTGLQAFISEFSHDTKVRMYIKTHHSHDNEIFSIYNSLSQKEKNYIFLIDSNLSSFEVSSLISQADCCFFPSRGEGFLLPAAEAMYLETLVCSTDCGGNREFCTPETSILIPTRLERSTSVISRSSSAWLVSEESEIRKALRHCVELTPRSYNRTVKSAKDTISKLTWDQVATSFLEHMEKFIEIKKTEKANHYKEVQDNFSQKICIVSTINQRCGISTYTENLVKTFMQRGVKTLILAEEIEKPHQTTQDSENVKRLWSRSSIGISKILNTLADMPRTSIIVQHHPGIIGWEDLILLLDGALKSGHLVTVELHSVDGYSEKSTDMHALIEKGLQVIVHSSSDYLALVDGKKFTGNVHLFPHPINKSRHTADPKSRSNTILLFGICLPHKGFHRLFKAIYDLSGEGIVVKARCLIAVDYKNEVSIKYANYLFNLRKKLNLERSIEINFDFNPIEAVISAARDAVVAVFPYDHVEEGASGAARVPMAEGAIILTSNSKMFDDLKGICPSFELDDEVSLTKELRNILLNSELQQILIEKQREYIDFSTWDNHVVRLEKIMQRAGHASRAG